MEALKFCDVERDGRLLLVTIRRPDVMNALHPPANQELARVFDDFEKDPELWIGIITGAGDRAFSAGNDLKFQAAGNRVPMPATRGRYTTGMTTTFWITRSFIFTKSAARLAGSISDSAAFQTLSYSPFCQRVLLRPCHLLPRDATSQEANWSMNRCGSGSVIVVVYIWMSVAKWL